jgi:hypothetical protein
MSKNKGGKGKNNKNMISIHDQLSQFIKETDHEIGAKYPLELVAGSKTGAGTKYPLDGTEDTKIVFTSRTSAEKYFYTNNVYRESLTNRLEFLERKKLTVDDNRELIKDFIKLTTSLESDPALIKAIKKDKETKYLFEGIYLSNSGTEHIKLFAEYAESVLGIKFDIAPDKAKQPEPSQSVTSSIAAEKTAEIAQKEPQKNTAPARPKTPAPESAPMKRGLSTLFKQASTPKKTMLEVLNEADVGHNTQDEVQERRAKFLSYNKVKVTDKKVIEGFLKVANFIDGSMSPIDSDLRNEIGAMTPKNKSAFIDRTLSMAGSQPAAVTKLAGKYFKQILAEVQPEEKAINTPESSRTASTSSSRSDSESSVGLAKPASVITPNAPTSSTPELTAADRSKEVKDSTTKKVTEKNRKSKGLVAENVPLPLVRADNLTPEEEKAPAVSAWNSPEWEKINESFKQINEKIELSKQNEQSKVEPATVDPEIRKAVFERDNKKSLDPKYTRKTAEELEETARDASEAFANQYKTLSKNERANILYETLDAIDKPYVHEKTEGKKPALNFDEKTIKAAAFNIKLSDAELTKGTLLAQFKDIIAEGKDVIKEPAKTIQWFSKLEMAEQKALIKYHQVKDTYGIEISKETAHGLVISESTKDPLKPLRDHLAQEHGISKTDKHIDTALNATLKTRAGLIRNGVSVQSVNSQTKLSIDELKGEYDTILNRANQETKDKAITPSKPRNHHPQTYRTGEAITREPQPVFSKKVEPQAEISSKRNFVRIESENKLNRKDSEYTPFKPADLTEESKKAVEEIKEKLGSKKESGFTENDKKPKGKGKETQENSQQQKKSFWQNLVKRIDNGHSHKGRE